MRPGSTINIQNYLSYLPLLWSVGLQNHATGAVVRDAPFSPINTGSGCAQTAGVPRVHGGRLI